MTLEGRRTLLKGALALIPAVVLANLRRTTTGLKAGWIVVTGSFTGFHPIALNESVRGEFEGFGTMEATIVG